MLEYLTKGNYGKICLNNDILILKVFGLLTPLMDLVKKNGTVHLGDMKNLICYLKILSLLIKENVYLLFVLEQQIYYTILPLQQK
jgi:hypothetical protein